VVAPPPVETEALQLAMLFASGAGVSRVIVGALAPAARVAGATTRGRMTARRDKNFMGRVRMIKRC
jgi:hypothetical protein